MRFMDNIGDKQAWMVVSKGKPKVNHLEKCAEPISAEWAHLVDVKYKTGQVAHTLAKWRERAAAQRSVKVKAEALAIIRGQERSTRLARERTAVVVDIMPKLKGAWFVRTAKGGRPELQGLHAELLAKQDKVCMVLGRRTVG